MAPLNLTRDDGSPLTRYLVREGYYGPLTAEALRAFQRWLIDQHKLVKADGRIDPSSASGWTNDGNAQFTIVYLNRQHRDVYGKMMDESDFPEPLKSDVKANKMVG
jgi:peptidoglycan hydrolase-like protein with peptidoglycan-binding domain